MKKLALLCLIPALSFANGNHEKNSHEDGHEAGQAQEQIQGNTQTLSVSQPDSIKVKNVPAVFAPGAYPTAPCRVAGSIGGAVAGFGIGGGGSKEDKECTRRETARMFWSFGQPEAALTLLCLSKVALADLADQCAAMIPERRQSEACCSK